LNANETIRRSIVAVLATTAAATYAPQLKAAEESTTASGGLEEVIVTAQRRSENIQNVPITIQALTGETLQQLNVATIEDYVKYVPGVSTGTLGPGQGNIFMRGLSTGVTRVQGTASVGGFPNVAVYLDDQSAMLPGRNLDIYAADMERVEVLEGPQGTLFGAGAQAGVVRYITNKPKLNATTADFTGGYGTTAHGDQNSTLEAVLNIPLIADKFAIRGVVYNDSRGGYINNVPSEFHRQASDLGLSRYPYPVPTDSVVANNYDTVANAINPVTYKGLRVSGLYKFNEDWDVLVQQSFQDVNAQGVFFQMPKGADGQTLNPLEVTIFTPGYDRDRFTNTAVTINGRIGDLKAVYSGAYLDRHFDSSVDYTNYSRAYWGTYYQCTGLSADPATGKCYTPVGRWVDKGTTTHLTQEARLSTPDDWRLRGLVGFFYEDFQINDDTEWLYRTVPNCSAALPSNCFHPIYPPPDEFANDRSLRNGHTGFFDDFQRTVIQRAAFMSLDYDIIPKVLTITGGTRYFNMSNTTIGGNVFSFYCKEYNAKNTNFGPCTAFYGSNLGKQDPHSQTSSGFRSKGTLSWKPASDALVYFTWSQGFRQGGFNRGTAPELPDNNGVTQYFKPKSYVSDDLTNKELGWKTSWLDRRLQINGAVYQEDWKNVQVAFFCPACGLGNLTFGTNGPDYRVRGIELELVARVTHGLTIQGSASWNSSNETNSPFLINNNPKSPTFGQSITSWCDPSTTPCTPKQLKNVYGPPGSPLAESPPLQANLRVRYEWAAGDYQAFWQVGGAHSAHSYSDTGNISPYLMPSWTTFDASIGVSKDAWRVELYGQNLSDENKSQFTNNGQQIVTETPMRPRVLGLRFGYKFTGK
jgi:outer membrane receptor protein involved in Fe transport